MADDIVNRLRNECQCSDDCRAVNDPCIPMHAADEIERLQEQVDIAHSILASAAIGWIIMGTDYYALYWEGLRNPITQYWKKYGGYFKEARHG